MFLTAVVMTHMGGAQLFVEEKFEKAEFGNKNCGTSTHQLATRVDKKNLCGSIEIESSLFFFVKIKG